MTLKFRLQRVLDLRCSQEELAKKELACREGDYQQATRQLNLLLDDEERLWELIREQQAEEIDLLQLRQICEYNADLKEQLQDQEEKRQECLSQLERQRIAVKACWQKRRVLEILRGKAAAEHKELLDNREQRSLDEIVLFSFTGGATESNPFP
ncbi:MAG TPA: flagellar export protein FliJ [Firmicutes bacterium]|nr:flagellar export protein FliJ [Bacillota bacterium]